MTRPAIAVLGLGEAGGAFARDLAAAGADVRAFDPVVPAPSGVSGRESDADAVRDADLVISLVTAHESLAALDAARSALRPGSVWADLNTSAPSLKQRIEAGLPAEVGCADVAIMAPVPPRGLATKMNVSGPAAERVIALLGPYGARLTHLPGPTGLAASRKLLRSILYKGLAAAVVEALDGARAAGCEEWMHEHVAAELTAMDASTVDRLVQGSHDHALRRIDEMEAAAEQLRDLGIEPYVACAAADVLRRIAGTTG